MAESEEELKSFWMKVKEESEKFGLKLNIQKTKIMAFVPSVQFSRSVMSDSLWPHVSQHTKPPCPSPTPGVHSNSCPSSPWCHPAISSSVIPFSSCPQSLPASRLVITFLPRSKHLLISWLQSSSTVILEPPQNKVSHCFHCIPIYLPWSDVTRYHDLSFLNVEF